MSVNLDRATAVLNDVFGYPSFREGQREIVSHVLSGKDVLGVMPTGGGKSLCYQVPALLFPACTLVVSPLIALITDQVMQLQRRGIKAEALHSDVARDEMLSIVRRAQQGDVKLLYVAPERLDTQNFRDVIVGVPISLLAVDEAHCISEWGHDFRPAYRSITRLFEHRSRVPILAVTATATPDVRSDIVNSLKLASPAVVVRGFDRPNLTFAVSRTTDKTSSLAKIVLNDKQSSIIAYAGSRRNAENLSSELVKRGVKAGYYHAGMRFEQREAVQREFVEDSLQILVATNAFGMGVDKPNVRHVVHTDLTLSLEAYYQEAGRAGRDGKPASCTLLYNAADKRLMDFFIEVTYPDRKRIATVVDYLYHRANLQVGGSAQSPILADHQTIAADTHLPVAAVRGVLNLLQREGVSVSTSRGGAATLRLRTSASRLREFVKNSPASRKPALEALERPLLQSNGEAVELMLQNMQRTAGVTQAELGEALRALQSARIASIQLPYAAEAILLLRPRPEVSADIVDQEAIRHRREIAEKKRDQVIRYAETPMCKRNFILSYFGDTSVQGTCGRCSSCLQKDVVAPENELTSVALNVIRCVHEVRGKFGRNVVTDILTGRFTTRVAEYGLNSLQAFGSEKLKDRSWILREMHELIDKGLLVVVGDDYPTLSVTPNGAKAASPLPKQKDVVRQVQPAGVNKKVFAELLAFREKIATQQNSAPLAIMSNHALERLATDLPSTVSELRPGDHGGSVVIAQFGEAIVRIIASAKGVSVDTFQHELDDDVQQILHVYNQQRSLNEIARAAKKTTAVTARLLQRAIESGAIVEIGNLVPESDVVMISEYLRDHRFAKLRHVREHVSSELDLPSLRVAVAFARQHLFGVM